MDFLPYVRRGFDERGVVLRPASGVDHAHLVRTFILWVHRSAPNVRPRLLSETSKDSTPSRERIVDLETAVVNATTATPPADAS